MAKPVLDRIAEIWPEELEATSLSKTRAGNDTSMPFMHVNVALEEGVGDLVFGENIGGYGSWTAERMRNKVAAKIFKNPTYCLCLQDSIIGTEEAIEKEVEYLRHVLCEFLPERSSFERNDQPDYCEGYSQFEE